MARVFTDGGAMKLISAAQRLTNDLNFSIAFWINRTATPAAQRALISATDPTGAAACGWWLELTTGNLVRASFPFGTLDKVRTSSSALTLNGWMHVLVTHLNTGFANTDFLFYFNGKQEAGTATTTGSGTAHDTATASVIEVGASAALAELAPPAAIGPISIWNRALSPAEALGLAMGMHPSRFAEGLVEYFGMETAHLEEGSIAKLVLLQGATNPTSAIVNPAIEAQSNPRQRADRGRMRIANAGGAFTPLQRRTLDQFGSHSGGRRGRAA